MKVLDIDLDYFIKCDYFISSDSSVERLAESEYKDKVWTEEEVRRFFECNLGLSRNKKIPGRNVVKHNEALYFWQELISKNRLQIPFEVIHVDSHADLGLGYASWAHICNKMLSYPVEERPMHAEYEFANKIVREGIGDYLLYAIAYRMVSSLTYCGNPYKECNDYVYDTMKDFNDPLVFRAGNPVENTIQLLYNKNDFPHQYDSKEVKQAFIEVSIKEPEVPFLIIPRVEDVHFDGNFDFAVMAQSPNYTPQSADFIMDIFKEYIEEV